MLHPCIKHVTIQGALAQWGYLAVAAGTLLEGETVVVTAGALAHRGDLSLILVMAAAFAGSVAGDQLWFFLGRRYGMEYITNRPWLSSRAKQAERLSQRLGDVFVFTFRFIYGIRIVSPILIGASGYPTWRYVLFNTISGVLWSALFSSVGWLAGSSLQRLLQRAGRIEEIFALAILTAIVLAAMGWLTQRHGNRR